MGKKYDAMYDAKSEKGVKDVKVELDKKLKAAEKKAEEAERKSVELDKKLKAAEKKAEEAERKSAELANKLEAASSGSGSNPMSRLIDELRRNITFFDDSEQYEIRQAIKDNRESYSRLKEYCKLLNEDRDLYLW